jgi:uncharacterized Zn finger protein
MENEMIENIYDVYGKPNHIIEIKITCNQCGIELDISTRTYNLGVIEFLVVPCEYCGAFDKSISEEIVIDDE